MDLTDHPMMTCPLDTPRDQLNAYFEEFNRDLPESLPVDVKLKISSRLCRLLHHNYVSDAAELNARLGQLQALLAIAQEEVVEAQEGADRLLEVVIGQVRSGRLTEQEAAEAYGEPPAVLFGPQPPRPTPSQAIDVAARLLKAMSKSAKEGAKPRKKPRMRGIGTDPTPGRAKVAKAGAATRNAAERKTRVARRKPNSCC